MGKRHDQHSDHKKRKGGDPNDKRDFEGEFRFGSPGREKKLRWSVNDFRLSVIPPENFHQLNEMEQVTLFDQILAKVFTRSRHPDGTKSAVIAITTSGHMLVASNTQLQHEYHKDCAEVNILNLIGQLLGEEEKLARLDLMIGFEAATKDTPPDKQDKLLSPCGKCVDGICHHTQPEARIYVHPASDGTLPLVINNTAHHVDEVKPGEVWSTRLTNLLVNSVVSLSKNEAALGKKAWESIHDGRAPRMLDDKQREKAKSYIGRTGKAPKDIRWAVKVASKAAQMHIDNIRGIPELAVSHSPDQINKYLFEEIKIAYQKRKKHENGQHNAERIRCAIVRLADGTYHAATEIVGPEENATLYAEVTAVGMTRLQHQSVTDLWVMEMNPEDIANGLMKTSPKEALERVYKRRPKTDGVQDEQGDAIKDNVKVHFIPFNDGKLTKREVEEIARNYDIKDVYISRYPGAKHLKQNGNGKHGGQLH